MHSAENIRKHYSDICAAWGLNPEDLFKTTADNASNMKKAFKVSIWDNAVVEEGHEDHSDDEDEIEEDYVMVDAEESDLAEGLGEGYRKPCSIHTLNLLVNDILKTIPAKYRSVVTKCKIAAAKQHRSNKLSEVRSKALPEHCQTRWNGQFVLMEAILSHYEEVKTHIGLFVESDCQPLKTLVDFLKPFFVSTKMLEAEKVATIHHVIPVLCRLEHHLLQFDLLMAQLNFFLWNYLIFEKKHLIQGKNCQNWFVF